MFDLFNCDEPAPPSQEAVAERVQEQSRALIVVISTLFEALDAAMRYQDEQLRRVENSLNRILTNRLNRQDQQIDKVTGTLGLVMNARLAEQDAMLAQFQQRAEAAGYPFVSKYPPPELLPAPESSLSEGLYLPAEQLPLDSPSDIGGFASAAGPGELLTPGAFGPLPPSLPSAVAERQRREAEAAELLRQSIPGPVPAAPEMLPLPRPDEPEETEGEPSLPTRGIRGAPLPDAVPLQPVPAPADVPDWVQWAVRELCRCLQRTAESSAPLPDLTVEPLSYLFGQRNAEWHKAVNRFFGPAMARIEFAGSMDEMYRQSIPDYDQSDLVG